MTVTLREIRRLQDKVAEEIKELKENPDADYDRLAELRTLSFNISMVFLRYSMEKDSTEIELGPADSKIVSALKPFKQEQEKSRRRRPNAKNPPQWQNLWTISAPFPKTAWTILSLCSSPWNFAATKYSGRT